MKRTTFLMAGACCLLFAMGFGFFLIQYVREGAGLQCYGWMFCSGSVLVGLVHVTGFVLAAFTCFAVGVGLLARGFVGADEQGSRPGLKKI